MATVTIFTPENRLASILKDPGGVAPEELVRCAETRVVALRPRLMAAVTEQIAAILRLGKQDEAVVFADGRALGDAALAVAELAGAVDRKEVGEIARGIRIMVEGLLARGVWHSGALDAHLEAITLLSQQDEAGNVDFKPLLTHLRAVRLKVGLTD